MCMIRDVDVDEAMVRQKDSIIALCNNGQLSEAQCALNILSEFWQLQGYGYKIHEMQVRINDKKRMSLLPPLPKRFDSQGQEICHYDTRIRN